MPDLAQHHVERVRAIEEREGRRLSQAEAESQRPEFRIPSIFSPGRFTVHST